MSSAGQRCPPMEDDLRAITPRMGTTASHAESPGVTPPNRIRSRYVIGLSLSSARTSPRCSAAALSAAVAEACRTDVL
jgi:hypothetical protein